jgi:hypothetical protein
MTGMQAAVRHYQYELYVNPQRRTGPPTTLGKMRELSAQHLIGFCHNDACRHQALIDMSDCPDTLEVRWFQQRAKCSKCGGKRVDVRPNWKDAGYADQAPV